MPGRAFDETEDKKRRTGMFTLSEAVRGRHGVEHDESPDRHVQGATDEARARRGPLNAVRQLFQPLRRHPLRRAEFLGEERDTEFLDQPAVALQ